MLMGLRAEKSLESQSCFGVTPPLNSPDLTQSSPTIYLPDIFSWKERKILVSSLDNNLMS